MTACDCFRGIAIRLIALLSSCIACGCASGKAYEENSAANKTGIWWSDPELVAKVIVGYRVLEADHKYLLSAARSFGDDVMDLFLLFDAWDSDAALIELAALSSYYTGESSNEIYSCIVVRKGPRIVPFLEREAQGNGECASRFAEKKGVCVEEKWRRSRLRSLSHRIESGERCTVDQ